MRRRLFSSCLSGYSFIRIANSDGNVNHILCFFQSAPQAGTAPLSISPASSPRICQHINVRKIAPSVATKLHQTIRHSLYIVGPYPRLRCSAVIFLTIHLHTFDWGVLSGFHYLLLHQLYDGGDSFTSKHYNAFMPQSYINIEIRPPIRRLKNCLPVIFLNKILC